MLTLPIAIDRSKPREAGKSLLLQGVRRLKEGNSIVIFPEGTRSRPGEIRRFSRSGATLAEAAGVPVVPIAHNAGYAWPPRTFLKFPYKVTVEIGKPIVISDQSVNEITEQAESWIRNTVVVH
jgi:1-acyl-sn-glycerol-3-phosphate acyltransferase